MWRFAQRKNLLVVVASFSASDLHDLMRHMLVTGWWGPSPLQTCGALHDDVLPDDLYNRYADVLRRAFHADAAGTKCSSPRCYKEVAIHGSLEVGRDMDALVLDTSSFRKNYLLQGVRERFERQFPKLSIWSHTLDDFEGKRKLVAILEDELGPSVRPEFVCPTGSPIPNREISSIPRAGRMAVVM